jgi:hypothetical protein
MEQDGINVKCSEAISLNKQVTIVNTQGRSRKHHRCCPSLRPIVQKIAGRIYQTCNDGPQLYFLSVTLRPSALIQIENNSPCIMQAIIYLGHGRTVKQTIKREQQVTLFVPSIKSLKIRCMDEENTICRGFYSLCLG